MRVIVGGVGVIGMLMIVQLRLRRVLMVVLGAGGVGMTVDEAMAVLVFVLVGMTVDQLAMAMQVLVEVAMAVAVLMGVLQFANGAAAALTISEAETVEGRQIFIEQKFGGRQVADDLPLVHDQGTAGQFADEEHIMTDQ